MLKDLHLLRFPARKTRLLGLWLWRAGAWGILEKPFLPFPTPALLSYLLCVCSAVLSHRALWEKTLHQQQQDNKGHVNERTGGGRGKGDFGSNNPSSRASVFPSTPSSLNQMGLDVRARGSYRDHPT